MVKRYGFDEVEELVPLDDGDWCRYEDYLSLQAALREALRNWKALAEEQEELEHIQNLERQFLDI